MAATPGSRAAHRSRHRSGRHPPLSPQNRRANISEELRQAADAFKAADALIGLGLFRDAANRMYYAAHHATLALLLTEELEPTTRAGIQTLFGLHFVKPGKVPASMAPTLRRLYAYREASDYTRGFVMPEEECRTELAATERYIGVLRDLLRQQGWVDA